MERRCTGPSSGHARKCNSDSVTVTSVLKSGSVSADTGMGYDPGTCPREAYAYGHQRQVLGWTFMALLAPVVPSWELFYHSKNGQPTTTHIINETHVQY